MDRGEFKRVFDQVKPTPKQEQAMLDRLLAEKKEVKAVSRMKKLTALLAAAALLLMACAFTVATGLDQRILNFLGIDGEEEKLLSPSAVAVDAVASSGGAEMAVKQVLADRYSLLVLVEFTAPEGMRLDQEEYTFDTTIYHLINEKGESLSSFGYFSRWYMVEDQNPTDNKVEMIGRIQYGTSRVAASVGTDSDYETTLDQQDIVGLEFLVRGFHQQGTVEEIEAYRATANESQRKLLESKWSVSIPVEFSDPGWRMELAVPLNLGKGEGEIREIYLSPMTLHIGMMDVSRDDYYDVEKETGAALLEQTVILRDREGNELLLDGGGMSDFNRETTDLHCRLGKIIDPEQYVGGTLTILGQTFSLDNLQPVTN